MEYKELKHKIVSLFDWEKLQAIPGEWGFFNETDGTIRRLGYATNLTESVISGAIQEGVDFLLTHHDSWEFIYGLKESCNRMLQEAGVAHGFFHAPLDDADFGTSASLAGAIGLRNCIKVMPYANVYYGGVIGDMEPMEFGVLTEVLAGILNEPARSYRNNDKPVRRVAVAAGGGNMTSEMRIAVQKGCDTYITGEYVLYSQQYAEFAGMNLLVGSHTNTEILGVKAMARRVAENTDIELVRIGEPAY